MPYYHLYLHGVADDWCALITGAEGVAKLLGDHPETQLAEGQEEQVMYVGDDVAPQEADEEAVAMMEEPYGVNSMYMAQGGLFSILYCIASCLLLVLLH